MNLWIKLLAVIVSFAGTAMGFVQIAKGVQYLPQEDWLGQVLRDGITSAGLCFATVIAVIVTIMVQKK